MTVVTSLCHASHQWNITHDVHSFQLTYRLPVTPDSKEVNHLRWNICKERTLLEIVNIMQEDNSNLLAVPVVSHSHIACYFWGRCARDNSIRLARLNICTTFHWPEQRQYQNKNKFHGKGCEFLSMWAPGFIAFVAVFIGIVEWTSS